MLWAFSPDPVPIEEDSGKALTDAKGDGQMGT
jgi:hypothetical protein